MAKSVNEELFDLFLQHQHYLLAVEEHVIAQMTGPLRAALIDVEAKLQSIPPSKLNSWTGQRTQRLQQELSALVRAGTEAGAGRLLPELTLLFQAENIAATKLLRAGLPAPVFANVLFDRVPLEVIQQMIQSPLGGVKLNDRLKTLVKGSVAPVKEAITTGIALGEGPQMIARRIRAYVEKQTMYNAERIARTEVHRVAVAAQRETYDRNTEVIKALEFMATLDDRTCTQCGLLDGQTWEYPLKGVPDVPVHPMCRCVLIPITKSWRELGFDQKDLKGFPGLKDLDGRAVDSPTYGDWLARQSPEVQRSILGPSKFAEYKKGNIPFPTLRTALPAKLAPLPPGKLSELLGLPSDKALAPAIPEGPMRPLFTQKEIQQEIDRILHETGGLSKKAIAEWRRQCRLNPYDTPKDIWTFLDEDGGKERARVHYEVAQYMSRLTREAQQILGGPALTPEEVRSKLGWSFGKEKSSVGLGVFDTNLAKPYAKQYSERVDKALSVLSERAADNGLGMLTSLLDRHPYGTDGLFFAPKFSGQDEGLFQLSSYLRTQLDSVRAYCMMSLREIEVQGTQFLDHGRATAHLLSDKFLAAWRKYSADLKIDYETAFLKWRSQFATGWKAQEWVGWAATQVTVGLKQLVGFGSAEPWLRTLDYFYSSGGSWLPEALPRQIVHAVETYSEVLGTLLHEYGHALETRMPAALEASNAFLARRTEGFKQTSIFPGTPYAHEKGYWDHFFNPYTGKVYTGHTGFPDTFLYTTTEVISMGIEHTAGWTPEALQLMKDRSVEGKDDMVFGRQTYDFLDQSVAWAMYDPDHAAFTLNVLSGRPSGG
jgi:SPP1 gp7 family putative phage head morphogenesis protein